MSELHPEMKAALTEIRGGIAGFDNKFTQLQRQVDEIDAKLQRGGGVGFQQKSGEAITEIMAKLAAGREDFLKHKSLVFEIDSPLLSAKSVLGAGLTSATAAGEIGNATGFRYGAVRKLFQALPLDSGGVFQTRETDASGWNASPQVEAQAKNESTTFLSGDIVTAKTIAHWIAASKQALDDVAGLSAFLDNRLLWGLAAEIEQQLISGDNIGQNLNGLINQATEFDTSLLLPFANYDFTTVIGAAATQCKIAGFVPTFAIMNPRDVFAMRFTRDTLGQFIAGPPALPQIVESTAMPQGAFLAGDSSQAVIRVRMKATIDLSESHDDFFTRNMVAIRAEERLCLQVLSPAGFIYGALSTSPLA